MQIEIGQVWKTRQGSSARVIEYREGNEYPWWCKEEYSGRLFTVTNEGLFSRHELERQSSRDLVELIQLVEHMPKDADAMRAAMPGGIDAGGSAVYYSEAQDSDTLGGFFVPKNVADDMQHYLSTGRTAGSGDDFTTAVKDAGHPYHALAIVLRQAFEQAASGKDCHATDATPFEQQPMMTINRENGSVDGFLFQARKKALESKRLPHGRNIVEVLGAINYLAGAVIAYETWAKEGEE